MSFLSKIFNFLKKLLSKIVSILKKILPYVLAGIAIWLALGNPLVLSALGLTIPAGYASAALVMGASFILAPDETTALVTKVADAAGDAVKSVASAVGNAASGVAAGFLSSPLGLAVLGFGAYFLFFKDKKKTGEQPAPMDEVAA